jgi:hypothetical protein
MNLDKATVQELKEELAKREAPSPKAPMPLEKPNWDALRLMIIEGVAETVENGGHEDDDFAHYVYEAAMEAVYGKDFFIWFNAIVKD